jgi:Spy/CpxP family protein refolding chaperone
MTMKRTAYATTLFLIWLLAFNGAVSAQGHMMGGPGGQPGRATEPTPGGMMAPQMMQRRMQDMHGMTEGTAMPRPRQMVHLLKGELGLSDEQVKQLTQIFSQAVKAGITQHADLRLAEFELGELLEAEPVDIGQVEGKLKAIEGLRTSLRLSLIKAHEQAKGVLTLEQRQKLERLHDHLPGMIGPGMMGMMEMMGAPGPGGMGMMGPQMMQQMMPGMMGGQPGGTAGQSHPHGR